MPVKARALLASLLMLAPSVALAADAPKKVDPNEQYVLTEDSKPHEGVPKGKVEKFQWKESKIFPGTIHDYWVYVPAQYDGKTPACVYVSQDGIQYNAPVVFDNLIAKKQMPVTIGIMINPGYFPPKPGEPEKKADGKPNTRSNRSVEYDSLGDKYAKFLLEEIIPEVAKTYKLTDVPEGRLIAGASSGGICAFNVAWERPDAFRKVFTSIGSFTNIRGGNVFPDLVLKADKKPIRVYQQDGKNDIVNQFGSWPEANERMAAAWDKKGYDHVFVQGEGTHNGRHAAMLFPDAMRWMWRDWPGVEK
jgi:enterochelin esterase family protein